MVLAHLLVHELGERLREAVRERLDCSEAFAKQVVRQKAQRRASTSLKTSPTEDDYAKPRVQLRATSKRQRGLPA